MKIAVKNLGNIEKGDLELNNLTLIVGKNNSGKTYLNYLLYMILNNKNIFFNKDIFSSLIKDILNNGLVKVDIEQFLNDNFEKINRIAQEDIKNSIHNFFSTNQETFINFDLDISLNKQQILRNIKEFQVTESISLGKDKKVVFEALKDENSFEITFILEENLPKSFIFSRLQTIFINLFFSKNKNIFLLPAERTGLNLFYRELNTQRNTLFDHLQKSSVEPMELFRDLIISKYPQPISDYIQFLNDTHNLTKLKSSFASFSVELHKTILNGKYRVDKNQILYMPYRKDTNKSNFTKSIPIHLTSSTVKTFFSLSFYLEHIAQIGDYIIIDEPELNLHPDNQRKVARLLAKLVNGGINIIISTHSDYIVRELNSLIILKDDFKSRESLKKRYNYLEDELIDKSKISAYLLNNNSIEKMEINSKNGIIADTFDEVINSLNSSSDDIYYSKMEDLECE